jgi:hypothetical protein
MTRAGALALSAVLVAGVSACGDDADDEDATPTADEVEADAASFCDSLVAFNTAVFDVELEDDTPKEQIVDAGKQLAPLADAMADSAPESVADAAGEINDAVQPLLDGDAEKFNADSIFATYTGFVADSVDECGFDTVGVEAVDYAFAGVPEVIEAGSVALKLTNKSEAEEHEMVVLRRPDGEARSFAELLALPEDQAETATEFTTIAFAPPGGEGATLADLTPGDYAMVCFIPVGGEDDGAPHFTKGMVQEFRVE